MRLKIDLKSENENFMIPFNYNHILSSIIYNKIADLDAEIQYHHIDEYPMLLQNTKICETIIKEFPALFKKLDESQITENIISILEVYSPFP